MAHAVADQALLYALRSPTTPLDDKVQRAVSALDAAPASTTLPALVRDWALEYLARATRAESGAAALQSAGLWALTARTTEASPSTSPNAAPLPIFVAFVALYAANEPNAALLRSAAAVWRRLAGVAMRKATVDSALEGYEKLVAASVQVCAVTRLGGDEERAAWEDLAVNWLKPLRSMVLDAGKGGKKIPAHTLSLLPTLLPLLSLLPTSSPFRQSLLQTVQLAIFNVENLKRGLARDSYTAGAADQSAASTADSELLAALAALPSSTSAAAYAALPSFTDIYSSALAAHSAVLFPLPAKANFPTPSAQKSALEVLGLTKRRELAGRWVKGVIEYLGWAQAEQSMEVDAAAASEKEKALALAGVLEQIETADLYRSGQAAEHWAGVLAGVVSGAVDRLEQAQDAPVREALIGVLAIVARLEHAALEADVPRVLAVLARTACTSSAEATTTSTFLADLVTFHSRSVSLPTFLSLLSDALASTAALPSSSQLANNFLMTHAFTEQLGRAVSGIIGGSNAVRATWENLVMPVLEALAPSAVSAAGVEETSPSPAKRRKLSSSPTSASTTLSAASRLRIATLLVRNAPASALSALAEPLKLFVEEVVDSRLEDFVKASQPRDASAQIDVDSDIGTPSKKDKKRRRKSGLLPIAVGGAGELDPEARLGVELLELRYAAVERLSREGLLEAAGGDGEKWWEVRAKRREGLREVVESGAGESAVVAARTLLQHFELAAPSDSVRAEAQSVIKALLACICTPAAEQSSSGFLRGLKDQEVPVALWELVARRWLPVIDVYASDEQLKQVASLVTAALAPVLAAASSSVTFASTTSALLQRADFWELSKLQGSVQAAVLNLVTLPSLTSPSTVLSVLASTADDKTLSALRSLRLPTLLSSARQFPALVASVPLEYLGKELRVQLSERALALDLWLSASDKLGASEKEQSQIELRRFVAVMGVSIPNASEVLAQLMDRALPGAREATLTLYRSSVVDSALAAYKATQSITELVSIVEAFGEKPLQNLAKSAKSGDSLAARLTTREQAFLVFVEALAAAVPESTNLPASLADVLNPAVKNASKALSKAIPSAVASLQQQPQAILRAADLVEACRVLWLVRDWLSSSTEEDASAYAEFSQTALAAALVNLPALGADPAALENASAVLKLLSHRVERERKGAKDGKASTELFETAIAAHLALRAALGGDAEDTLDAALARTASMASTEEYSVALDSLAGLLAATGEAVSPSDSVSIARLEHALAVAQVLVLNGPEGSSRIASAALSEILRQLALVVEHVDGSSVGAVKVYTLAARFIESVCGERPLLLSRFNISSVLSIVSHTLRPSAATPSPSASSAQAASQLFQALVGAVAHVVRHRKDHVVPLFPLLISTLSSFISVLRRGGLGTLGNSLDEVESAVGLGQRAEREAKTTFPVWVWAGGAQAIGKPEAKAVGRLLGSLTAKTTTTTAGKRKHGAADDSSINTSLAAPLSKHAPFLLLNYLRACVHPTCPIPSALRNELQGGWFEVMDAMGKWEREALMKGMLGEDEEAERGVLRGMWKSWEKERYRG
ncbi:hypothetical protein JCM10450v2_005535 [Rhodotorula kratochvilovae]